MEAGSIAQPGRKGRRGRHSHAGGVECATGTGEAGDGLVLMEADEDIKKRARE